MLTGPRTAPASGRRDAPRLRSRIAPLARAHADQLKRVELLARSLPGGIGVRGRLAKRNLQCLEPVAKRLALNTQVVLRRRHETGQRGDQTAGLVEVHAGFTIGGQTELLSRGAHEQDRGLGG